MLLFYLNLSYNSLSYYNFEADTGNRQIGLSFPTEAPIGSKKSSASDERDEKKNEDGRRVGSRKGTCISYLAARSPESIGDLFGSNDAMIQTSAARLGHARGVK